MSERKTGIPKTNIYNRLYNLRCDIRVGVFGQIDEDLQRSGWDMITDKVNNATLRSLDEDCFIDIMELL